MQYGTIGETFYFPFAANDETGTGVDGLTPGVQVRLGGASSSAAPVHAATPVLLSHSSYPPGSYEVAIIATVVNGFSSNNVYSVFATIAIGTLNPTGYIGSFKLGPVNSPNLLQRAKIATLASQTSFTSSLGSADNDAYNNCRIIIEDATTGTQKAVGVISDYVGSTKGITLAADPGIFTMAVGDTITIWDFPNLQGLTDPWAIVGPGSYLSGTFGERLSRLPAVPANQTTIGASFTTIANAIASLNNLAPGALMGLADNAITEAKFAANTSKYIAVVKAIVGATKDFYTVVWWKNGEPVLTGITLPKMWVYKNDNTDLVGTSASPVTLTQIGSTGTYTYEATTTARIVAGSAYLAKVTATIDSGTRTSLADVGRDAP